MGKLSDAELKDKLEAFSEAELNNYEQYLIWKKQRKKDALK